MPIVGYGNNVVNTLRIWDAQPINTFSLDSAFDKGDYQKAVEQENLAKNLVEVLYPNDNHYAGKELRLKQQYFFISASLQVALKKYQRDNTMIFTNCHEKVVFQMNDTHPTVAVAELMRLLLDQEGLNWDEAWEYHNKTLCIHQPHYHGRGAGKMADRAVLPPASACIPDCGGDQPPFSDRGTE